MSSTNARNREFDDLSDQEDRITAALEDTRDHLEALADSDTAFSDNAQAALDWLNTHTNDDDETGGEASGE